MPGARRPAVADVPLLPMSWIRLLVHVVLAMLWLPAATEALAERRALLVGVSDYPALPAGMQRTPGARNDVELLRITLLQRGFATQHVRTLADGLSGADPPTRANILRALDDLAAASGPGDFVFLHLAGHGSLEPGAQPGEGPSPIFLPIDIGRWDGGAGHVVNAVTRRDLRERVERIVDRGAFVWGVFDTCHAANFVRQGDRGEVRARFVTPAALGVPTGAVRPDGLAPAAALLDSRVPIAADRGRTAFFYASQAGESAVELPLPAGTASRRPHGLFSFHVAMALQGRRPISYRQLGQSILTAYGVTPYAYATPVFTGDALDHMVLGQRVVPVRQWPLRVDAGLWVDAGLLSGAVPGAVLAVVADPTVAEDGEVLGHLGVTAADVERALLQPVPFAGRAPIDARALRNGQYLRLAASPPAFALRVAYDAKGCPGGCRAVGEAVRLLRALGARGVDLQWVDDPGEADIVARALHDRVDLVPPSRRHRPLADGANASGLELRPGEPADALAARLARALHAVARARNLLSLAAQAAGHMPATGLTAELRLQRRDQPEAAVPLATVPRVATGDMVGLSLGNTGPQALDVTVLYLDARYGVEVLFPGPGGESNRLPPGQWHRLPVRVADAGTSGMERLLVIARPAMAGRERSDFSFLAQPSLARTRAAQDAAIDALADAAFAEYRRQGLGQARSWPGTIDMQVFTLDRQPVRRGPAEAVRSLPR